MNESLRERVLRRKFTDNDALAEKTIEGIRGNKPTDAALIKAALTQYIQYKFDLNADEMETENLIRLSQISIRKAIANNAVFRDQKDCHGTTESMIKKILVIQSIEKRLQLTLSRDDYMGIDTVSDLANIVTRKIEDGE